MIAKRGALVLAILLCLTAVGCGGIADTTTPADTTPAATTPAETTPADTTPADTTPAATTPTVYTPAVGSYGTMQLTGYALTVTREEATVTFDLSAVKCLGYSRSISGHAPVFYSLLLRPLAQVAEDGRTLSYDHYRALLEALLGVDPRSGAAGPRIAVQYITFSDFLHTLNANNEREPDVYLIADELDPTAKIYGDDLQVCYNLFVLEDGRVAIAIGEYVWLAVSADGDEDVIRDEIPYGTGYTVPRATVEGLLAWTGEFGTEP